MGGKFTNPNQNGIPLNGFDHRSWLSRSLSLSLSLSPFLYLSISLSLSISIPLSLYLSLSFFLFVSLPLSISLSFYICFFSLSLSVFPSFRFLFSLFLSFFLSFFLYFFFVSFFFSFSSLSLFLALPGNIAFFSVLETFFLATPCKPHLIEPSVDVTSCQKTRWRAKEGHFNSLADLERLDMPCNYRPSSSHSKAMRLCVCALAKIRTFRFTLTNPKGDPVFREACLCFEALFQCWRLPCASQP